MLKCSKLTSRFHQKIPERITDGFFLLVSIFTRFSTRCKFGMCKLKQHFCKFFIKISCRCHLNCHMYLCTWTVLCETDNWHYFVYCGSLKRHALNAYIAHILHRHFYCWLSYEMIRETWLLETSSAFKDVSQEQNAVKWTLKPVKQNLNKFGKYRTTSWCQDSYTRHAGSIGCAIWHVFRRSLARSSILSHIVHRDLDMN